MGRRVNGKCVDNKNSVLSILCTDSLKNCTEGVYQTSFYM